MWFRCLRASRTMEICIPSMWSASWFGWIENYQRESSARMCTCLTHSGAKDSRKNICRTHSCLPMSAYLPLRELAKDLMRHHVIPEPWPICGVSTRFTKDALTIVLLWSASWFGWIEKHQCESWARMLRTHLTHGGVKDSSKIYRTLTLGISTWLHMLWSLLLLSVEFCQSLSHHAGPSY